MTAAWLAVLETSGRVAVLGLAATPALLLLRRRPAAWRHAVYLCLLLAMAAVPLLHTFAPDLGFTAWWRQPLVLATPPDLPPLDTPIPATPLPSTPAPVAPFDWSLAAASLYGLFVLAGLAHLAYRVRRARLLAAASEPVSDPRLTAALEAVAAAGAGFPLPEVRASSASRVPFTAGWLRPVVILPANWPDWDRFQLHAVLAHELAHVTRADWATSILAAANRALFFLHPLSWWVERRLAALAEEACDEAALAATGDPRRYAEIVLGFAWALQGAKPQAVTAMARSSKVGGRIEKILEGHMRFAHSVSNRGRVLLSLAAAAPLIYGAAALTLKDPEPLQAPSSVYQKPGSDTKPVIEYPGMRLTPAEAAALQARVSKNAEDLDARGALLGYYFTQLMAAEWKRELFWLVDKHPEAPVHETYASLVAARRGLLSDDADFAAIKGLWKAKITERPADLATQLHAYEFFEPTEPDVAYECLQAAGRIDPNSPRLELLAQRFFLLQLSWLQLQHLPGPIPNPLQLEQAGHWLDRLEATGDARLIGTIGLRLIPRSDMLGTAPREQLDRIQRARAAAARLLARAHALEPDNPQWLRTAEQVSGSAPDSDTIERPRVTQRVEAAYSEAARQAKAQGDVTLAVRVGLDGTPTRIDVVSGHPLLAPCAVRAVEQWRFTPGRALAPRSGIRPRLRADRSFEPEDLAMQPIEMTVPIEVRFRMMDGGVAQAGAPAGPVMPGPPPSRVSVPWTLVRPNLLNESAPALPPLARQAHIAGDVTVRIVIAPDGSVREVRLVSGHPLLAQAALDHVRQYRFREMMLSGKPVENETEVTIPFSTKEAGVMPRRVTVGGSVQQALLVHRVEPVYPPLARQARIQGVIRLRALLAEDGSVKGITLDSGHPLLVQAAIDAVKQWRFKPTLLNGQPIEVVTQLEVPFQLDSASAAAKPDDHAH